MTGKEYWQAATSFEARHKAAVGDIFMALAEESVARQRGARLVDSPVKLAVAKHCEALLGMLAIGREFLGDA